MEKSQSMNIYTSRNIFSFRASPLEQKKCRHVKVLVWLKTTKQKTAGNGLPCSRRTACREIIVYRASAGNTLITLTSGIIAFPQQLPSFTFGNRVHTRCQEQRVFPTTQRLPSTLSNWFFI